MPAIERISARGFAPFGHLARPGEGLVKSVRNGGAVLTKSPAEMRHDEDGIDFALDFYQVRPEGDRLDVAMIERHPHSSQIFIPMAVDRYMVVVWPDQPGDSQPRAFLCGPEDAVIYNAGVWHAGIVALGRDALFASAMWRTRGGVDAEFHQLAPAVSFDLAGAVL